jgi:Yip1 domain
MNLVERVKGIMLSPSAEWAAIAREPYDPKSLYTDYMAILALIPATGAFAHAAFIGNETMAGVVRLSVPASLACALYSYVLVLVIVYIAALITDWLAPRFGGQRDFGNALKLSIYCNTPYCLAGIFLMIPSLSFLVILGLYGLYLFYLGAPVLMKTPRHRGVLYATMMFMIVFIVALPLGSFQALFWM